MGLRPLAGLAVALVSGVLLGGLVLLATGNAPWSSSSQATASQFERTWLSEVERLDWPADRPTAPPPFVEGSPNDFGKTVAQTTWFCRWADSWVDTRDADPARADRALGQLASWTEKKSLWLTAESVEPALRAARGGDAAPLRAIRAGNCSGTG